MNASFRSSIGSRAARGLAAGLIGLLLAATAIAQQPTRAIEECLETGTDLVALPAAPAGTLTASECRDCPKLRLGFLASTRYYVGDEAVPYARLREAAARGPLRLYVFYRPGNRSLTRIKLVAAGNK
jgi:hypothetical protein